MAIRVHGPLSAASSAYINVKYDLDQWTCWKWVKFHSALSWREIPTYFPLIVSAACSSRIVIGWTHFKSRLLQSLLFFLMLLFHSILMPKKETRLPILQHFFFFFTFTKMYFIKCFVFYFFRMTTFRLILNLFVKVLSYWLNWLIVIPSALKSVCMYLRK